MRKITLLGCLVALGSSLFAQQSELKNNGKVPVYAPVNKLGQNNSFQKNGGSSSVLTTIYSQDFGSGVPAGWAITDSSGGGKVWTYTTTGPANFAGDALLSTTAGNGYMIMDDDFYGQGTGPAKTEIYTTAINCSANASVKIKFQDFYRHYVAAASEAILLVSNDSINWTDVYHAETGLANNAATPNPHIVDIDITAIAANQATVYLNFTYRGDWGYFWEVDDIEVYEPAAVNAAVAANPIPNTGCQLSATSPISINVINAGANPLTNVPVSYKINGGTAVNEVVAGPINAGATFLYTFTQTADLSAGGVYSVELGCQMPGDADASNDTSSTSATSYSTISVQTTSYAMGFEANEDYSGWAVEDVDGDGVAFDIIGTFTHTGAACLRKQGSGVADNNWIFTTCFDLVAGTNYSLNFWYKVFDAATACDIAAYVATQNTNTSATQNIVMCPTATDTTYQNSASTFTVPANGTYYIGFNFYSNGQGTSSLRLDDINVSIATGINDVNASNAFEVFPNPSNGVVTLNGTTKEGTVTVMNQMGQVVLVKSFDSLNNAVLDLTAQPVGLYHIQVKSGNSVSNQSVNISR